MVTGAVWTQQNHKQQTQGQFSLIQIMYNIYIYISLLQRKQWNIILFFEPLYDQVATVLLIKPQCWASPAANRWFVLLGTKVKTNIWNISGDQFEMWTFTSWEEWRTEQVSGVCFLQVHPLKFVLSTAQKTTCRNTNKFPFNIFCSLGH